MWHHGAHLHMWFCLTCICSSVGSTHAIHMWGVSVLQVLAFVAHTWAIYDEEPRLQKFLDRKALWLSAGWKRLIVQATDIVCPGIGTIDFEKVGKYEWKPVQWESCSQYIRSLTFLGILSGALCDMGSLLGNAPSIHGLTVRGAGTGGGWCQSRLGPTGTQAERLKKDKGK